MLVVVVVFVVFAVRAPTGRERMSVLQGTVSSSLETCPSSAVS